MEDERIIGMYFERDEGAVTQTAIKYGAYCYTVSYAILACREDCEECVNDTYMRAWNSIPPTRPKNFKMFLAKIARNLSFDRWRAKNAAKRGGEVAACREELSECIASGESASDAVIADELAAAVNTFLRTLPERDCNVFLRRYFFSDTIQSIASKYGISENNVSLIMTRSRKKLKKHLISEGLI